MQSVCITLMLSRNSLQRTNKLCPPGGFLQHYKAPTGWSLHMQRRCFLVLLFTYQKKKARKFSSFLYTQTLKGQRCGCKLWKRWWKRYRAVDKGSKLSFQSFLLLCVEEAYVASSNRPFWDLSFRFVRGIAIMWFEQQFEAGLILKDWRSRWVNYDLAAPLPVGSSWIELIVC